MPDSPPPAVSAAEKVKQFPATPGVYLMKDAQGRVIYIGKAKNLRSRAGTYFHKARRRRPPHCDWIGEVADIDFLAAESEVDALLMEARLIKDIQPKYNRDLKDDKTFPYLEITTGEDFPRVNFTREPPTAASSSTGRSRGPRACAGPSRSCRGSSSSAPARWTSRRTTRAGAGSGPACSHSIDQCTAPCNLRIDRETYRKDIRRLQLFLDGKKDVLLKEMDEEMREASKAASVREGRPAPRRDQVARERSTCAATSTSTPSPRSSTSIPARG